MAEPLTEVASDNARLETMIFLSYAREDEAFVRRLHGALAKANRAAWVDWTGIPPTAEWLQEIYSAIESTHAFAFIISPDSVASEVCKQEIAHAVEQNKRLIPLVYRDAHPIPEDLARLNWIWFRESDDFETSLSKLIKAIDTDLDWVRVHTRLLMRTNEWHNQGYDKSLLLRGSDLKTAERWLSQGEQKDPRPMSLQTQYITESRKAETQRYRRTLGAVTVALIVAIVLGGGAWMQWNRASSRALAASAIRQLPIDPERSLLLAIKAATVSRTAQAEDALRQSLLGSRVRAIMRGHKGGVAGAAFSPDGQLVVTASLDKTARVWEAATGRSVVELHGHQGVVKSAAFSPDGQFVVTASVDKTARVWEAATGRSVVELHGHQDVVNSAAFSPDGQFVVTASVDKTARVWEAATGRSVAALEGHTDWVNGATFSPDGRFVLTTSRDKVAQIWETITGISVSQLKGHADWVVNAAFSRDGRLIATASFDKTARIWDVSTGQSMAELRGHGAPVNTVAFSPDGKYVVTASDDNTAQVWEAATGRPVTPLRGHSTVVDSAAFSPDGQFVVTAAEDNTGRVWNALLGACPRINTSSSLRNVLSVGGPDGYRL